LGCQDEQGAYSRQELSSKLGFVPKKLVRRGRVRGYRPTRGQLVEILELAQKGIEENSVAKLSYSQGNQEFYSSGTNGKILPENLGEIVTEAGEPNELSNLSFSISQDSPVRRVDIQIGPGGWMTYLIESDDQTWAHGRYHEITEKSLANRSLYAKGRSSTPQVPKEGTNEWRPAAWELVSDWRANAVDYLAPVLWLIVIAEIATIIIAQVFYQNTHSNTVAARNDRHNAHLVLSWFSNNSVLLFFISLSYVLMIIFLGRRMRTLLESKVILHGSNSFISQLKFQSNRNDAVQLAVLYLTFLILIVGIVALLVQVFS
jgi:hypothetical protein